MGVQDNWLLTPLHLAVPLQRSSTLQIVELLCAAKATISIPDQDGQRVLHTAAIHAGPDVLRLLLEHVDKVRVDGQDSSGCTALHYAIRREIPQSTQLLLAAGADPTIVDKQGTSALDAAASVGDADTVRLLSTSMNTNGRPYPFDSDQRDTAEDFLRAHYKKVEAQAEVQKASVCQQEAEIDRKAREQRDKKLKELIKAGGGYQPPHYEDSQPMYRRPRIRSCKGRF